VTFKNDEHTVITIGYEDSELQIVVNGEDYSVSSYSPSVIQVNETVYPVLAWKFTSTCVLLQGSTGILVMFCGSSRANAVVLLADPDVAGGLEGLCGTANDNWSDDYQYRDGSIELESPWWLSPPEQFPLSWLTSPSANGSCDSTNVRRKRDTQ
ncbi:unnamed protein product, partial [Meganyctiphanes norvegica]